ncbi:hypothetical protein [uncultured Paraglaciecola sp.]|uniref:hypothetical protein n=1 Tax=uncultured Paraglaciecola sp. TaxID=1765024 RepID=UPI0026187D18|nr:hypothetical protein [uncultured Paraglaciecola sp.]
MMKTLGQLFAVCLLICSTTLLADCQTQLAEIDKRLAKNSNAQSAMLQGLRLMRDQGAEFCRSGDEISAKDTFNSITAMFTLFESKVVAKQASKPASQHLETPLPKVTPSLEEMVRVAKPQSGLTPYVVVTSAHVADRLNWNGLRRLTATNYSNRWDDLSMVDSCLWISADELAKRLGLSVQLTATNSDFQCKYRVKLPNGKGGVLLSLYVEFHQQSQNTRNAESRLSEGPASRQFSPFNLSVDDLNVYVNKRSRYLYVFPKNGQTLWRIGYKAPYGLKDIYQPSSNAGIDQHIGSVFVRMIVEKFASRL